MSKPAPHPIYFSFFMFTVDLQPDDRAYTEQLIRHMRTLSEMGYEGFDLPIAPTPAGEQAQDASRYARLKEAFDKAGLERIRFTTNVAATDAFNPSAADAGQREAALRYLKTRVDITAALDGRIMAGPIVLPYGAFPTGDNGAPIWSDALQEWVAPHYRLAQPILEELASYAADKKVKLAIEPVDHWETAPPNLVTEVESILNHIASAQIGICIDSAHVVLGSDGRNAFDASVRRLTREKRLHYVHISAPDRGAVHDSWIPWPDFLGPILSGYEGPFLIEVFNALPVFLNSLRLTRRKFWIPGEDTPVAGQPSAYDIARQAIGAFREEMKHL